MDVTPDRHTRWYQGIQRIYRNAVVRHLRTTLRDEYPEDWESLLQRPFAQEWPTIVESAHLSRTIGVISSTLRDAADYLGVNHFYNLFEVHFEPLFPAQRETTPEARKQEKAAVLSWAKEIKTVRDPESHPPVRTWTSMMSCDNWTPLVASAPNLTAKQPMILRRS